MSKTDQIIQPVFHISPFTGVTHVQKGVAGALSSRAPIELEVTVPENRIADFREASRRHMYDRKRIRPYVLSAISHVWDDPRIQDLGEDPSVIPVIINAGNIPGPVLQSVALRELFPQSFLLGLDYPKWGAGYFDLATVNPSHKWRTDYRQPQARIGGVPNHITPEKLKGVRPEWSKVLRIPGKKLIAVLVGGDVGSAGSPRYRPFTLRHAEKMVTRIRAAVKHLNANLVITTSRRTPDDVVDYLSQAFAPAPFGQIPACTYSYFPTRSHGPNPYMGFMAVADAIIVTSDSLSMINEAIDSRKPVYSIRLKELMRIEHERFYGHLIRTGHLIELPAKIEFGTGKPIHAASQIASEVFSRLGIRRPVRADDADPVPVRTPRLAA